MYFLLKIVMFDCYVSLPEGTSNGPSTNHATTPHPSPNRTVILRSTTSSLMRSCSSWRGKHLFNKHLPFEGCAFTLAELQVARHLGTQNHRLSQVCLVRAQPPPCCSFVCHLVGKIVIHCSFAHH